MIRGYASKKEQQSCTNMSCRRSARMSRIGAGAHRAAPPAPPPARSGVQRRSKTFPRIAES
eukprot:1013288-Pyramimonas_sp.AAC.1